MWKKGSDGKYYYVSNKKSIHLVKTNSSGGGAIYFSKIKNMYIPKELIGKRIIIHLEVLDKEGKK
jgi:hypothetical protein